nr:unnamed protein product [Digitaria exilis]
MASNSALKTAVVLMIVLFAGQLLVATPVAADADGRLLQGLVPSASGLCDPSSCSVSCFEVCITECNGLIGQNVLFLACRKNCVGKCSIN